MRHVRKHRAPKGALRRRPTRLAAWAAGRQKAPSAKRCIKTAEIARVRAVLLQGQKAPSAKRCIKTAANVAVAGWAITRQKAPSAKRCIKTTH